MRAAERWITFEEIINTIENPDNIQKQPNQVFCFKRIGDKNILLVYAKDANDDWVVITVIRTSKMNKYWL